MSLTDPSPFDKHQSLLWEVAMILDVEALVMNKGEICIIEQVAYVLVDNYGNELACCKIMVRQEMRAEEISVSLNVPLSEVLRSIWGYEKVTNDNYIHSGSAYVTWERTNTILMAMANSVDVIFAKGADLERTTLGGDLPIVDLVMYGCPKYPAEVHDPLLECKFFSMYVPKAIHFEILADVCCGINHTDRQQEIVPVHINKNKADTIDIGKMISDLLIQDAIGASNNSKIPTFVPRQQRKGKCKKKKKRKNNEPVLYYPKTFT